MLTDNVDYLRLKDALLFSTLRRTICAYVQQRRIAENVESDEDPSTVSWLLYHHTVVPEFLRDDQDANGHLVLHPIDAGLSAEEMTSRIARLLGEGHLETAVSSTVQYDLGSTAVSEVKGNTLLGAYVTSVFTLKKLFMGE